MNRNDLLTALKHHMPYDASEAESLARTIAFIEAEPDAFKRSLAKGHVCGSALLIGYGGDKVLLMEHKALGKWIQFGGHADGDENVLRVAIRETLEESGISNVTLYSDGIADVDVHPIPDRPDKNEGPHVHYDIRYIFCTDETQFNLDDAGVTAIKWYDYDEAIALNLGPAVVRMLDKWQAIRAAQRPEKQAV